MPYSYLSHLTCSRCHVDYDADAWQQVCTCGSPLLAQYDLASLARDIPRDAVSDRESNLWRYHEFLPVRDERNVVTLGEGGTPLDLLPRLGADLGIEHLYLKDEGVIPTGSFKARGAAVGISRAKELGIERIAMPTNGNAGAAWATYAARAGMEALIVMPADAPEITRKECAVAGARLFLVDGLISDAGKLVSRAVAGGTWKDVSTLKEPYRIEGKKTMGFEIVAQLGWTVPDVIIYPTGGGVGIIGIYKALRELQQVGWIGQTMPRLVAVQATGCAPIVRAWEARAAESTFWDNARTIAFGITVPKALGDFLILQALYDTDGYAIAVDDAEILVELRRIGALEGVFICPEGAATVAAARRLRQEGWIKSSDLVVLLNTGAGVIYPDTVRVNPPVLAPGDTIPEDILDVNT